MKTMIAGLALVIFAAIFLIPLLVNPAPLAAHPAESQSQLRATSATRTGSLVQDHIRRAEHMRPRSQQREGVL
jgi:hypothetical protein